MWDKEKLTSILIEAGKIALHYYDSPECSMKADGSIVTNADHEIENLFCTHFDNPSENSYLLGEESIDERDSEYVPKGLQHSLYIVDPIDGTVSYANHIPTWGISIGYAAMGRIIEGAIYFPITEELFISEGEKVYLLEIGNHRKSNYAFRELKKNHQDYSTSGLIAITQELAKSGKVRIKNPVHTLCCAVMPLAYLLCGRYQAYLANLKIWDLAGGLPLLIKLNFEARFVASGSGLTTEINSQNYYLEGNDVNQWKTRSQTIFAYRGIADHILPRIGYPPLAGKTGSSTTQ